MKPWRALSIALFVAPILACGSGEPPAEAPPPAEPISVAPAEADAPTPPPEVAVSNEADIARFRALIDACNAWNVQVGNKVPGEAHFDSGPNDPTRSLTVSERREDGVVLADADGARLLLTPGGQVQDADGKGVLPTMYQFCPSETFLSTAD